MALERSELIKLAKATAKASMNPSINYSYEGQNLTFDALNETFRKEMNGLASSYAMFPSRINLKSSESLYLWLINPKKD